MGTHITLSESTTVWWPYFCMLN